MGRQKEVNPRPRPRGRDRISRSSAAYHLDIEYPPQLSPTAGCCSSVSFFSLRIALGFSAASTRAGRWRVAMQTFGHRVG